jgi:hypothetical protein
VRVTAVDISGWAANDANYFVPLLARTAQHFEVREVSADKAHLSRKNLNAVESVGGMPLIPFKSNTVDPTEAGMWARMYHLFMYRREQYMEHYHKRSNIETAHSMIKGKFGSALRSKSDTGQINEALCKVLAHNIVVLSIELSGHLPYTLRTTFCAGFRVAQKVGILHYRSFRITLAIIRSASKVTSVLP